MGDNYPAGVTDADIERHFGESEPEMTEEEHDEAIRYASIGWLLDAARKDADDG